MTPQELQGAIDTAALELNTASTPEARRIAWRKMQELHTQRTPETVRAMEQRMGLCPDCND